MSMALQLARGRERTPTTINKTRMIKAINSAPIADDASVSLTSPDALLSDVEEEKNCEAPIPAQPPARATTITKMAITFNINSQAETANQDGF